MSKLDTYYALVKRDGTIIDTSNYLAIIKAFKDAHPDDVIIKQFKLEELPVKPNVISLTIKELYDIACAANYKAMENNAEVIPDFLELLKALAVIDQKAIAQFFKRPHWLDAFIKSTQYVDANTVIHILDETTENHDEALIMEIPFSECK